jgi:hypothetical protein
MTRKYSAIPRQRSVEGLYSENPGKLDEVAQLRPIGRTKDFFGRGYGRLLR